MAKAYLTISSKNYSSWCLRGWLLCKMARIDFEERRVPLDEAATRAELLLASPSVRVPCLNHMGIAVWDTLAIAEYLHELSPDAGLLPKSCAARAHCRAICGEMHAGFFNLRSALPMNLKARLQGFSVPKAALADIERIKTIWHDCLAAYGGSFLFGEPCMADARYAPVCTRFITYGVQLDPECAAYCGRIMAWPPMTEWLAAALAEPEKIEELELQF